MIINLFIDVRSAILNMFVTHLYPHTIGFEGEMVATVREYCGCDVTIGKDMETVVLDSGH